MTTTTNPRDFTITDPLIQDILSALDSLFGRHPGFRAVHAKGIMCSGTFTPSLAAATLTRAPHVTLPSTPVIVRFSGFAGVPTVPDNAPLGASPRGLAVRFYLGEHVHTDIVAHSTDGFPVRTGEEFLEFVRALAASGATAAAPPPIVSFLATHPNAKRFVETPKPIPTSFARESYFGVSALRFTNQAGVNRFGRFRIRPDLGNEYLTDADAAARSPNFLMEEISQRLTQGPVRFRIVVQVATDRDEVSDSSTPWPTDRPEIEFGTLTLTQPVNDADPEMRKIIFDPIPRVEGIDPSHDPLLPVRSAIYLLSGRRRRSDAAQ